MGFHKREHLQRLLKGTTRGVAFDHGIEENNTGVSGMVKDAVGVGHFVQRPTDRDKMSEDLIGLGKAMAEGVGVDLGEMGPGFMAMEEPEDPPFDLVARPPHRLSLSQST